MKVKVNQENCVGCGLCVRNHPEAFEWDKYDIAVAKDVEAPDDIIEDCPVGAIEEVR
jgi:ferredoxin